MAKKTPKPPSAAVELNPRQQRFVDEYLKTLNATQAVVDSGVYAKSRTSAEVQGFRLMNMPQVAAAIKTAMDERADRTAVTQDRIITALAGVAFYDRKKHRPDDGEAPRWSDSVRALELLGKHNGMFNKVEIDVADSFASLVKESMARSRAAVKK